MPSTRLQCQNDEGRRSRGARKRKSMVVANFETDCYDFFRDILPWSPDVKGKAKTKSSGQVETAARTSVYIRPEGKKLDETLRQAKKQKDSVSKESQVKKGKKKAAWISHDVSKDLSSPAGKTTNQECDTGSDSGISSMTEAKDITEEKSARGNSPRLPLYLLDPDNCPEDSREKERIMKSKYDKIRRDNEMKARVTKLKKENSYLKSLLHTTIIPKKVPTASIETDSMKTAPVYNKGLPFINRPIVANRSRPALKRSIDQATGSKTSPNDIFLSEKRRLLALSKLHRMVQAARELEKEKALIFNLYKQQSEIDKDDDYEAIRAAILEDLEPSVNLNSNGKYLEEIKQGGETRSSLDNDAEVVVIGVKYNKKRRLTARPDGVTLTAV